MLIDQLLENCCLTNFLVVIDEILSNRFFEQVEEQFLLFETNYFLIK